MEDFLLIKLAFFFFNKLTLSTGIHILLVGMWVNMDFLESYLVAGTESF